MKVVMELFAERLEEKDNKNKKENVGFGIKTEFCGQNLQTYKLQ